MIFERKKPPMSESKVKSPRSKPSPSKARKKNPPNTVRPGWIHQTFAVATLRVIQGQARRRLGTDLDVGDVASYEAPEAVRVAEGEGRQPVELLSRLYAHTFYRIPGVRKIEKRLEGEAASSGIASDFMAFAVQIARRNKDIISRAIEEIVMKEMAAHGAPADKPGHTGDGPLKHFPYVPTPPNFPDPASMPVDANNQPKGVVSPDAN